MVAGIDGAVVFQHRALAAELVIHADLRVQAHPLADCGFEEVDEHLAVVAPVPLIPNLAEECAPVFGIDGPVGHNRIGISGMGRRRV